MIDFTNGKFSPKALDFLQNSNARLNILHGSVRSSKTVNCSLRWITYCLDGPPGDLVMVGKTVATLQRNVLNDIIDLVGKNQFKWTNKQQGEALLLGRRVYCMGANSEEAEGKIRGATFAGALCDEISLYPRSFVDMLMTRLSVKGAMCFCNCNPGDPSHWFYTDFICNDAITNKKIWHFTLDDNPNLEPEYRRSLEEVFKGVFYERMILGKWVVAEGAIYEKFASNPERYIIQDIPQARNAQTQLDIMFSTVGIDFGGTLSGQAFNLTGFKYRMRGIIAISDYWTHDPLDANELADEFVKWLKPLWRKYKVSEIRADYEESVLIRTLRNRLKKEGIPVPIKNCIKGPILDRIHLYQMLFGAPVDKYGEPRIQLLDTCKHTIEAFKQARWEEDKENVRLDNNSSNIDNCDSIEYSTEPHARQLQDMIQRVMSQAEIERRNRYTQELLNDKTDSMTDKRH